MHIFTKLEAQSVGLPKIKQRNEFLETFTEVCLARQLTHDTASVAVRQVRASFQYSRTMVIVAESTRRMLERKKCSKILSRKIGRGREGGRREGGGMKGRGSAETMVMVHARLSTAKNAACKKSRSI